MKKLILSFLWCLLVSVVFAQAKKPKIMVVPSDVWCNENGFMMESDVMGTKMMVADYKKAVKTNADLMLVISKIGEMMTDRGFPLEDLANSLKSLDTEAAEESVTDIDEGGVAESPIDKLRKVAQADIWIQLTWTVNKIGPKKSVTFNMQGIDAYTNKQVAAASGTGDPSFSVELPLLLEEAVLKYMDKFNEQLQLFFDDMFANGREVSLVCRRTNDSDVNFESVVGDDELGFLIEDWVAANAQEGRFNTTGATENRLVFNQIRIPMFAANGRALDTRTWARGLLRELRSKYKLNVQLDTKGLGQAYITIKGSEE